MDIFKIFRKKTKENNVIVVTLTHPFVKVEYPNGSRTVNLDYIKDDICLLSKYFNGKFIIINMQSKPEENEIIREERIFVDQSKKQINYI